MKHYYKKYQFDIEGINIEYIDNIEIDDVGNAIIFFHAYYSGPSSLVIKKILNELKNYDLSKLKVIVADVDLFSPTHLEKWLGKTKFGTGNGEMAFVKDGKVVFIHDKAFDTIDLWKFLKDNLFLIG